MIPISLLSFFLYISISNFFIKQKHYQLISIFLYIFNYWSIFNQFYIRMYIFYEFFLLFQIYLLIKILKNSKIIKLFYLLILNISTIFFILYSNDFGSYVFFISLIFINLVVCIPIVIKIINMKLKGGCPNQSQFARSMPLASGVGTTGPEEGPCCSCVWHAVLFL